MILSTAYLFIIAATVTVASFLLDRVILLFVGSIIAEFTPKKGVRMGCANGLLAGSLGCIGTGAVAVVSSGQLIELYFEYSVIPIAIWATLVYCFGSLNIINTIMTGLVIGAIDGALGDFIAKRVRPSQQT